MQRGRYNLYSLIISLMSQYRAPEESYRHNESIQTQGISCASCTVGLLRFNKCMNSCRALHLFLTCTPTEARQNHLPCARHAPTTRTATSNSPSAATSRCDWLFRSAQRQTRSASLLSFDGCGHLSLSLGCLGRLSLAASTSAAAEAASARAAFISSSSAALSELSSLKLQLF